jgi:transposase
MKMQQSSFGLLNFYDCPIITGPLEDTHTKIKTLQKQAYGFRDHLFFKLKIDALAKSQSGMAK